MKKLFIFAWKYPGKFGDYTIDHLKYDDKKKTVHNVYKICRNENGNWTDSNGIPFTHPSVINAFNME